MAFAKLFSSLQAVLRGDKPSSLLKDMLAAGQFDGHSIITDMVGCLQNPDKHPEGDVWQHTLNVVDAAAQLKDNVPEEWRTAYMFAALLHDVGKPSVTTPDLKAHKHDAAGEPLARQFVMSLTNDSDMAAKVASIVLCHMRPWGLVRDNASDKAWRKLHAACPLHVLAYMSMADASGKGRALQLDDVGARGCLSRGAAEGRLI